MDLVEKTAIVSGAGRGIGKAIARQLAQEGATVLVNDLVAERADAVATALQDEGLSAVAFAADVSAESAVQAMVEYALAEWGQIDILVNNAGYLRLSPVVEKTLSSRRLHVKM